MADSEMIKVSVSNLKKKYPHPQRGMASGGNAYCVGGALCREVNLDHDFPNEQQLKEAILKANPRVDWYRLKDSDVEYFYSLVHGVIQANDAGNFKLSWKLLGTLLRFDPELQPME